MSIDTAFNYLASKVNIKKVYPSGFHTFDCPICSDKRGRCGLSIKDNSIVAHCFNCSYTGVYSKALTENNKEFLDAVMSPKEIAEFILLIRDGNVLASKIIKNKIEVKIEGKHQNYKTDDDAVKYIKGRYLHDINFDFRVQCDKANKYIIIPYYLRNNLVWYQKRLIKGKGPKYINASVSKQGVIFNENTLYSSEIDNVFMFEGAMDALSVYPYGIALAGSELNDNVTVNKLIKSNKKIIYCFDNDDKGISFANTLTYKLSNIEFTFVENVKDCNEYLVKTKGDRLALIYTLMQNKLTPSQFTAKYADRIKEIRKKKDD